jgi:hypothetical protein
MGLTLLTGNIYYEPILDYITTLVLYFTEQKVVFIYNFWK